MDATPNLSLPYIMAAQSQKHVTHNEAIRALDAILQLAVLDRDLTAPPSSPADGARYIVGGSPTGAWSGHAGSIAAYQDGAWMFYAPVEGWIAWIGDEDAAVVWDGSAWSALTTGGGGGGGSGSYSTLGINATADTTNRLTLAADATLLNHDGDGHRLKINKASASDTASLLYQDAFSGRAELGLAGDDDFHFKVSADGTTWKEAILIDRSTGSVSFPHTSLGGSGREVLAANRTYYVRSDGSDSNTGLLNNAGGAFRTPQKAWDATAALDMSIYGVTISISNEVYTTGVTISALPLGGAGVTVQGAGSTTAIEIAGGYCFNISAPVKLSLNTLRLKTTTAGHSLFVDHAGTVVTLGGNMVWDSAGWHQICVLAGKVTSIGCIIKGSAWTHVNCQGPAAYYTSGAITITVNNAPNFLFNFASAALGGVAQFFSNTYAYPTVTVTIASPGVVTYVGHGKSANDPVAFFNNGDTLPTGLVLGTTYYVKTVLTADTFTLSATAGGAVINTSGSQSGTHKLGATGSRYNASTCGVVDSNGAGASGLPGNTAGATASGGQYT